ncbi:hypothetical protein VFPBJ_02285 [Purpureocillium lilacinum]|uniref:Uncharacterized protein n=1 Tax=Purpureocillium lilacinum TaxID=33203 RepID=A0A179GZU2_PURLI|nr:hypothetical protein VFPBJ_02285 [Purpureocillium lilacinum]
MSVVHEQTVYVLAHYDHAAGAATICGVFAELQDANAECLQLARRAGITLTNELSTTGPDGMHLSPVEPLRWDAPEGVSCWVEAHAVKPTRVVNSTTA